MELQKEIIVLGDAEMGGGTLTDDFISDRALSELISKLAKKTHPIDLVFNGDTFDFLKCPYLVGATTTYPRYVTPTISLAKLKLIFSAHYRVIEALRDFVKKPRNNLYFIVGNHDYDLVYKPVQKKLGETLHSSENVHVRFVYHKHQVYAEHGHQYDLLNKINYQLMFLKYKGKTILNLPWVAFGLMGRYMHIKEEHPFVERIHPRPTLFSRYRSVAKRITWSTLKYFLLSIFYYPFRYFFDPTYTFSRELFWDLFRRIRSLRWDPDNIADVFKVKSKHTIEQNKILVFSHIHKFSIEQKEDYVILDPGCWRDEYILDPKTDILKPKIKYYVKIKIPKKGDPLWQVLPCPIARTHFRFTNVIKDEAKYIKKAAKEEGYSLK